MSEYVPVLPFMDGMIHHHMDIDFGCPHNLADSKIHMCQSDSDGTHGAVCTLFRNGEPWTPPAGVRVRICYKTPAGGASWYEHTELGRVAWNIEGNILTFVISKRVNNHIGITTVYLELNHNGLVMRSPNIPVVVQADFCAKEPKFFPDEQVGHIYYNVNGVSSLKDPFEVWLPAYQKSLEAMKKSLEADEASQLEAVVTVVEEELPEQDVVGTGTLADPIHYNGDQYLIRELHYLQDGIIYKCVLGTRVSAKYKLEDLRGLYVEKVKVIPATGPAGTRNDPIQFVNSTILEKDKFYVEKNALYLAIANTDHHPSSLKYCPDALSVSDLELLLG